MVGGLNRRGERTLDLIRLRASGINGCSVCLDMHARIAKNRGETDERLFTVAASRDAPYFTEAERAALALTWNRLNVATRQVAGEWAKSAQAREWVAGHHETRA